ncbi:MAG: shikimate kinase [Verrucomicrobia bacterium]|nr:MAG: shikimate kinase [Verrucomicrobiota bacterium]
MLDVEVWSLSIVNQPSKSIVLIGMMGAGKSCVGRCLQRQTKLALVDTDHIVALKFGISISEIFSKHGEQGFREAETQALRELAPTKPMIIVTGGGIVLREKNVDFLKRLGVIVWLHANEEALFERAYEGVSRIKFEGAQYRKDIAARALKK